MSEYSKLEDENPHSSPAERVRQRLAAESYSQNYQDKDNQEYEPSNTGMHFL